jgi:hypothetical protein
MSRYRIEVNGKLDDCQRHLLDSIEINVEEDRTIISGNFIDDWTVISCVSFLISLGIKVLSVQQLK